MDEWTTERRMGRGDCLPPLQMWLVIKVS